MERCTFFCSRFLLLAAFAFLGEAGAQSFEGELEYDVHDLVFSRSMGFDVVDIEGADHTGVTGAPILPAYAIHIALPTDAVPVGVKITSLETLDLDGTYDIMPVSKPVTFSGPHPKDPLARDPAVYNKNADYPSTCVEMRDTWDLVGQDFVTLSVHPVQYNPVTRKLVFHGKIRFELEWKAAQNPERETYNFSRKVRDHYHRMLRRIAFNPEDVGELPQYVRTSASILKPENYEYVIITINSFWKNHFKELADWRTQMGIPAKIVDTEWIYANYPDNGDPTNMYQDKIRNFIIDANITWGSIYFLLGGDAAYVPCHTRILKGLFSGVDMVHNDSYYADFDDDWVCEVNVGRACNENYGDIDRLTDKILTYEKDPPKDYGDKVFFMGFDLTHNCPVGEYAKEQIRRTCLPVHLDFSSEYDKEPGTHQPDVTGYMNEGQNFVNHIDHGDPFCLGTGWVEHGDLMDIGHAVRFSNGSKYFNFYTVGCYVGDFVVDCWGEWLLRDNQGAVSFVGNSSYGMVGYSCVMTMALELDLRWFEALYHDKVYRAGETLSYSKLKFSPLHTWVDEYIFVEVNLLGDPALHLWTDEPVELDVAYRAPVSMAPQTYSVHVRSIEGMPVEGALVCVTNKREVYLFEETDAEGNAAFYIMPQCTEPLLVTVTAHNYRCHEGRVPVVRSE